MYRLLRDVYDSDRKRFKKILVLNVLAAFTAGIGTVMLIPMLEIMNLTQETSILPKTVEKCLESIPEIFQLCILLGIYIALVALKALLTKTLAVQDAELVQGYTAELRIRFYEAVAHAPWERFIGYKRSELLDTFVTETARVSYAASISTRLLSLAITSIVNVCVALWMSVPLTLGVAVLGGAFWAMFRPLMRLSKEYGKRLTRTNEIFFSEISNQINGIKEIRGYGIEEEQHGIFCRVTDDYKNTNIEYAAIAAKPQMVLSIGSAAALVVVFLAAMQIFHVSLGRMAVLVYVFGKLWPNFSTAQNYIQTLTATEPVFLELNMVMEELQESAANRPMEKNGGEQNEETLPVMPFRREIKMEKVHFQYRSSEVSVLDDITCSLPFGEITAFVGRSGAGKSTMVDLILGFLTPTQGRIMIDGQELVGSCIRSWQKNVSYIPQDPMLLNDTVRENLLRFHPKASEAEMVAALKKSLAWDFVQKLPKGIDTVIGDQGLRLSGGERQRIVLARALLGGPKLLVLDEATSALDYESERMIADCIRLLRGKVTVLLVAHRLSSIQIADHVLVIEDGRIKEAGTFSELIKNREGYLGKMVRLEE